MNFISSIKNKISEILNILITNRLILIFDKIIYSLQWYKRKIKSTLLKINIEFSNYCNLRCTLCNLDHTKKKIDMSEKLLDKFLNNLIDDRRFRSVSELALWSAGEPLIHPNFINLLEIFKKYKDIATKRSIKFPRVDLLTNGMLLNENIAKAIIKSNVISRLGISVDGGSREKFEEIRRGAKWDTLVKNVTNFVRFNEGRIKTRIICVIDFGKEQNSDWMSEEFKNLLSLVDTYELRYPHNWDGTKVFDFSKKVRKYYDKGFYFCKFLGLTMVLLPNGDFTVCCADANSRGIIGNLYENEIYSIYSSEKRKDIIKKLRKGRKNEIDLCKNCIGKKYSPFHKWIRELIIIKNKIEILV